MFTKQKVSLAAAALVSLVMCGTAVAAASSSTLTVNAELTSSCAVSSTATITFDSFSTLAPADQTANSGSTFTVACSTGMSAPTIVAAGSRTITNGGNSIPFNLSLTSLAENDDLPTSGTTVPLTSLEIDGTAKVVPLYARLVKANFISKPAAIYTGSTVTVSVAY